MKATKQMNQEGNQADEPRRQSSRWTKKAAKQITPESGDMCGNITEFGVV